MNSVKEKFTNNDVQALFSGYDVLVIMETHFKVRHKCPDDFYLVGRSAESCSKVGRGGVAVYAKRTLCLSFRLYKDVCPDAVILEIVNTNAVIIAPYIVPDNSKYKVKKIFSIIDFIIKNFKNKLVYIMGDLNARCGTPISTLQYACNPDKTINSNGRKMLSICADNDLVLVNGLTYDGTSYDSEFTYFRGQLRSQNDWFITNAIGTVASFTILPKMVVSDHSPCGIVIRYKISPTCLLVLEKCASGNFDYTIHDKSTILKPKIRLSNIDCSEMMIQEFNQLGESITSNISNRAPINTIAQQLNNGIYSVCKKFSSKTKLRVNIPEDKSNCSSRNFLAIADANLMMYSRCVENDAPENTTMQYLLTWRDNLRYAKVCEEKEYNVRGNISWKCLAKDDPRKMWKKIDYKDNESTLKQETKISTDVVHRYFKNIFQADHLSSKPTVGLIKDELENYRVVHDQLDQNLTYDELNGAIMQIGRGIGIDGLDKSISHLFPKQLRLAILEFLNLVFHDSYPEEWSYQLLRPEVKKGHSVENPKLRGVALSSLLPSIYDIMIDSRFRLWYIINPEQAGFRELQGCLIQIFALYLLMELARSLNETIFIGFIDYEKAFDFVNRYDLVKDLMAEKAGSVFTKAIASMYEKTFYVPRISSNRTGEPIVSAHGVTQGRKSSTSLFSFTMRNIPKGVKLPNSFLCGHHVFQLADDSSVAVNKVVNLCSGFGQLIDASDEKFMVTNTDKTFYLHLCDEPITDDIELNNGTIIHSAPNNEHLYLGMWFKTSAFITEQMKNNLNHRAFHIKKYYDWLNVNLMTPIIVKLWVLYSCMFAAYLHGCECWPTIDEVSDNVLALERKLLKHILQVKPSTPNAIIYTELGRCDMMATIKVRQKNFYRNCRKLTEEEAVMRSILEMCKHLPMVLYYENLEDGIDVQDQQRMKDEIVSATTTQLTRYKELTDVACVDAIYGQFLREDKRIILSKWRLSSHGLNIEKGRYTSPITPRQDRTCQACPHCVEDEHHVLFNCPLYDIVRVRFRDAFQRLNTVRLMLNPSNIKDAKIVGDILLHVEEIIKSEDL